MLFFDELDELELDRCSLEPTPVSGTQGHGADVNAELLTDDLGVGPETDFKGDIVVHSNPTLLSLQDARKVQSQIVRTFVVGDWQDQLRKAQASAGKDTEKAAALCEEIAVKAQITFAEKLGFDASPVGVAHLRSVFLMYADDPEIAHRNALIRWLLDPASQFTVPIPKGPARCRFKVLAIVYHVDGSHIGDIAVLLDNDIRALKENIFLASRIPWQNQRLFHEERELLDRVVISSMVRLNGKVRFTLKVRRPEVVQWLTRLKQQNLRALEEVPAGLMDDPEFILPAVQLHASVLLHSAAELRSDRAFFKQLLPHCGQALQFVDPALRSDPELVLAAVQQDAWSLEYATKELQADREIVMAAVQQDGEALQFAAAELRQDYEIVLAAIRTDPSVILHVPELQKDRKVVIKAVQQDWRLLESVIPEMQADREVVMAAVRQKGRALQYASLERRGDRDIAMQSIRDSGDNLRFAAPNLLRDREVVLAAVRQSGMILGVAAIEVQDEEIVLAAVRQEKGAIQFVDERFRNVVRDRLGIAEDNPWEPPPPPGPADSGDTPTSMRTHLAVLDLPETASKDEVKRRYHQLALQYHPDKFSGDPEVAKRMFQKISAAYEALQQAFDL